jgi:hypothetical protein
MSFLLSKITNRSFSKNLYPIKTIQRNFHSSFQRKGSSNFFRLVYGVPLPINKYIEVSKNAIIINRCETFKKR